MVYDGKKIFLHNVTFIILRALLTLQAIKCTEFCKSSLYNFKTVFL